MHVYCCWCSGLLSCVEGITCMFIVVDVVLYCHVLKELHACLSLLM